MSEFGESSPWTESEAEARAALRTFGFGGWIEQDERWATSAVSGGENA